VQRLRGLGIKRFKGSGFSAAAGQKNGRSNRERNFEKANIEYRIMNVECQSNVFCLFYKKMTERSESTLRHSLFDILRFCGSLLTKFHTRGSEVKGSAPLLA
jgi:hypothetical protein